MPTHYIPTMLIAVSRPVTTRIRTLTTESLSVREAFIVPEGTKLLDTAQRWAGTIFDQTLLNNTPLTRLRVVGCEHRSEGGMAYKVVTDQGYLVDLRENEFLEAFFQGRIDSQGYVQGEYVWSVGANQMRLVRVGSDIYNERLKAGQVEPAKTQYINGKALVIGHKYRTPMGQELWYDGRIHHNGKLKYAWWDVQMCTPDPWKTLTVTGSSIAIEDLGTERMPKAVFNSAVDGYGLKISRDDILVWPDGMVQIPMIL